mmetsp:Transcript_2146/g.4895  ORF Transcript_2146/g.4895 Transcript_2146/m.4895 type:complete len:227 (+) Transcript_2146:302-982(+)
MAQHDPHLHLREIPSDAITRRKSEWAESSRLGGRILRREWATVPDLLGSPFALRVKLAHVSSPQFWVSVPQPVGNLNECSLRQSHLLAVRSANMIVLLKLPKSTVRDRRPQPQRFGDAPAQERQLIHVVVAHWSVQLVEHLVYLGLHPLLVVWPSAQLIHKPCHSVCSGVMASKRKSDSVETLDCLGNFALRRFHHFPNPGGERAINRSLAWSLLVFSERHDLVGP